MKKGENSVRRKKPQKAEFGGADGATDLLKALANKHRLLLVCRLTEGECHVSQLETELGIGQPMLSQQLRILRLSEIVKNRREGKQVYYRLDNHKVSIVVELLCGLYVPPEKKFFHMVELKK